MFVFVFVFFVFLAGFEEGGISIKFIVVVVELGVVGGWDAGD